VRPERNYKGELRAKRRKAHKKKLRIEAIKRNFLHPSNFLFAFALTNVLASAA
jgi:hypothetical protein